MSPRLKTSLIEHLEGVSDPRIERTRRHKLLDILAIAICAMICGAEHWNEIAEFGHAKREWFARFLELPGGIPSHDTFARVFARLDPDELEQVIASWLGTLAARIQPGDVVAIDGKSVRGSGTAERSPLHIVSAWASAQSLLLGQVRTEKKSNEITAIPALLQLLAIEGGIVTIDAMGCQKRIATAIRTGKADYVLALKRNHKNLHHEIDALWDICQQQDFAGRAHDYHETVSDKRRHGREEHRQHWLIEVPDYLKADTAGWQDLKTLAKVVRERRCGEKVTRETHYYLSSLPLSAGAARLAEAVRAHWAVENQLHWSLDVSFAEDASRVRKDHAPANLALIRRIALTLLRQETSCSLGIKSRRRRAGWDEGYLIKVLNGQMI